ncbi:MAG: hypothetical protein EOP24_07945 [Hyphomicrobiales bacterium]|nr:MAG: hypothetical protein EOP24_07945 [Hyphomicrobiales bacterium]
MAGITLAIAEAKLAVWLAAEEALATSQSYEIEVEGNRRQLSRADLAQVAKRIDYWNGIVNRLTAQALGRSRTRTIIN